MNWEPSRNLFHHHLPSILHRVVDAGSLSGLWIWTSSAVSCVWIWTRSAVSCELVWTSSPSPSSSCSSSSSWCCWCANEIFLDCCLDSEWVQAKRVLPECRGGGCCGVLTELKMMICCCCWGPLTGLFSSKRTMGEQLRSILKGFSRLDANQQVNPLPAGLRMTRDEDICSWVATQS